MYDRLFLFDASSYIFASKCLYTILVVIASFGVFGNLLLFFIIVRSKSLRSPCNTLIASCAIFDVLHQVIL
ncbi:hypothetical protein PRIPAC_77709 [Pristionchus pacificus]|uniref:G protein-coupled receptor n=1 Tax=Pristionchus pacificus TaxID=54126 RepID=A0A2A6CPT7_PRIPA|nr:hypothetical protein PRIPAC_77709 [Pristionchus pacificus]|eukprot:PDM80063.1 G protein-coupled receptor [Pristionchus pacificus]